MTQSHKTKPEPMKYVECSYTLEPSRDVPRDELVNWRIVIGVSLLLAAAVFAGVRFGAWLLEKVP